MRPSVLRAPVPRSLSGAIGMSGTYRLSGAKAQISSELVLEDARVGPNPIAFQRGEVLLSDQALKLDLALVSETSSETVTVTGRIPFAPDQPLDVRVVSLGDGLKFLTGLTNDTVAWNKGEVDLRLLLGGTLLTPKANGYIVIKDAAFETQGQVLQDLTAVNTEQRADLARGLITDEYRRFQKRDMCKTLAP